MRTAGATAPGLRIAGKITVAIRARLSKGRPIASHPGAAVNGQTRHGAKGLIIA
jgi:hypothetical protein